jgi:hypothetical protein
MTKERKHSENILEREIRLAQENKNESKKHKSSIFMDAFAVIGILLIIGAIVFALLV